MKKKQPPAISPEWSHRVEVSDLGAEPLTLSLTADEQIRKDVARRFGIPLIRSLAANIKVMRQPGGTLIEVAGTVESDVTQICSITTEPLDEKIKEDFTVWFSDEQHAVSLDRTRRERQKAEEFEWAMPDDREDPELLTDGVIDVAELAVQYLSLAMNPFPQKEKVERTVPLAEDKIPAPGWNNPFAALKDWKNREREGK